MPRSPRGHVQECLQADRLPSVEHIFILPLPSGNIEKLEMENSPIAIQHGNLSGRINCHRVEIRKGGRGGNSGGGNSGGR